MAVLSVGGGTAPAQAACTSVNGKAFNQQDVPNGWGEAVAAAAKVAGVPASVLAAQLEAESGWNPNAKSPWEHQASPSSCPAHGHPTARAATY
jgi:hypothetical protein